MKIIVLADIHGCLDYLPGIARELADADLVLLAGDITMFGGEAQVQRVIEALETHNQNILAVHGNCDLPAVEDHLRACEIDLDCRCVSRGGVVFAGLGGALPCPGSSPNESSETLLAERLAEIKPALREAGAFVFLTHQPPAGTKVDGVEGRHTGSTAIREFILDMRPILAVSGHMHEAFGTDMLGGTLLVNPGPFRHGRYAVIELEDGRVRSTSLFPRE